MAIQNTPLSESLRGPNPKINANCSGGHAASTVAELELVTW